jgi:hypothetical protein
MMPLVNLSLWELLNPAIRKYETCPGHIMKGISRTEIPACYHHSE